MLAKNVVSVCMHGALDQIIVLDQTQRHGVSELFFDKISFKRVTQSAQPNNHALFITEIKKKSSLSELISIQQFCPVCDNVCLWSKTASDIEPEATL